MRRIIMFLTFIVVFVIGVCSFTVVEAVPIIGAYSLPDDEKNRYIEMINLKIMDSHNPNERIKCFDVSEDGMIALGYGSGDDCRICVFDQNTTFQYGFKFSSVGVYGIEFREDHIGIFFSRSEIIAVYDANGTCVDVLDTLDTGAHKERKHNVLNREHKFVDGIEYTLERDLDIGESYSRFVTVNEAGERTVLFDADTDNTFSQVFLLGATVLFFALVGWIAYEKIKSARIRKQSEESSNP